MMPAPQEAGLLALPAALCGDKVAEAPCSRAASQTSSGSGWSSGTHAQAVEQQAWSDGLFSLPSQGEHSIKLPPAQQAAAPADQQHQQLVAAAACMHHQQRQQQGAWPVCILPPAGPSLLDGQVPAQNCWQLSSHSSFGSLQLQQQPEAAAAAAPAAAPPDIDPWSNGLELVAASPPAAIEPAGATLPLTDAGLEALLAPFEDWPYLLQPAASAVQPMPATLIAASPACASAQPPQQQQQQQACTAAAQSPRSSSGSGGPAGCCTCKCGAAAAAGSAAAAPTAAPVKPPRRRGGRPRVYHHRSTASATAAAGGSAPDSTGAGSGTASAAAGAPPPAGQPFKKSGRGPKPKYIFSTQEEAADARRERNRKAALESYYRKKEHTERLQRELSDLREENAALQMLLGEMASTGLCPLLEASNEGINLWLAQRKQAAQEADVTAEPVPL